MAERLMCPGCNFFVEVRRGLFVEHDCAWSGERFPRPMTRDTELRMFTRAWMTEEQCAEVRAAEKAAKAARAEERRRSHEQLLAEHAAAKAAKRAIGIAKHNANVEAAQARAREWDREVAAKKAAAKKAAAPPRCGRKRIYTEDEAENAATQTTRWNLRSLRPEGRTAARAYHCPDCGGWHVTSTPPTRRTP